MFGYFKVQQSLSEMLRIVWHGSFNDFTAAADGFHGLKHFASRVAQQAAVRHPRQQHIRVSSLEQW